MQDTLKLAAFNARKDEITDLLNQAYSKYNELRYETLEAFGYSQKAENLRRAMNAFIGEFQDSSFEESDFNDHFLEEPADDRSEKLDEDEQYL